MKLVYDYRNLFWSIQCRKERYLEWREKSKEWIGKIRRSFWVGSNWGFFYVGSHLPLRRHQNLNASQAQLSTQPILVLPSSFKEGSMANCNQNIQKSRTQGLLQRSCPLPLQINSCGRGLNCRLRVFLRLINWEARNFAFIIWWRFPNSNSLSRLIDRWDVIMNRTSI